MIPSAIRQVIVSDPQIGANLAQWDFGSGEESAVFTVPAPPECPNPLVVISQDGGEPWGDRSHRGLEVAGTITVFGDRLGSDIHLQRLAHWIWSLLANGDLDLSAWRWEEAGVEVNAPERVETEEGFPGYALAYSVRAIEE